jgi:hypothetical protein
MPADLDTQQVFINIFTQLVVAVVVAPVLLVLMQPDPQRSMSPEAMAGMVSPATLPEHQYTIVAAGLVPDLLTMAQTDWAAAQAATAVVAEKTKMVGLAS